MLEFILKVISGTAYPGFSSLSEPYFRLLPNPKIQNLFPTVAETVPKMLGKMSKNGSNSSEGSLKI
jgi:hypothetical protein